MLQSLLLPVINIVYVFSRLFLSLPSPLALKKCEILESSINHSILGLDIYFVLFISQMMSERLHA